MAKIQFLKCPLTTIRSSIKGIDDSYRNPWDMYAELAQNSVDAIRKMQVDLDEKGRIVISVNAQEKSIIFEDNGCGIPYDELPILLNLFSSGKAEDTSTVGEKGVGLKFVLFQSTEFEIKSSDGKTAGIATIKDARLWKKSKSEDDLLLDIEPSEDLTRGTKITLKGIELERDDEEQGASLFTLSFDQFKFLLRNKTFLGETISLWKNDTEKIEIIVKYTDYNGNYFEEVLKNEYILPTENLSSSDIVDIDEFEKWLKDKDRSDTDKRLKLQGKILMLKGEYLHRDYRKIYYWACFLPTRRDWDAINKNLKLIPENVEPDDEWYEKNSFCLVNSGIYTATKGMPTGIAISHPSTGNAGYWPNCFMIFQDDSLKFDIGRKSIHGNTQAIYQAKAKEIFNKFTKYVTKYTSSVPVTPGPSGEFDRDEIVEEVKGLPDLNSKIAIFEKLPSEQEASVSAIFFELIGNKVIDDITPIYLGYRNKYDLYAYYTSKQTKKRKFGFYEFKSHLRHLTKDFADARKVFDEIDYVICWDVNDTDILQLNNFGINCEELEKGKLHEYDCPSSITHILTIPNCNPVYVIDLKKLV